MFATLISSRNVDIPSSIWIVAEKHMTDGWAEQSLTKVLTSTCQPKIYPPVTNHTFVNWNWSDFKDLFRNLCVMYFSLLERFFSLCCLLGLVWLVWVASLVCFTVLSFPPGVDAGVLEAQPSGTTAKTAPLKTSRIKIIPKWFSTTLWCWGSDLESGMMYFSYWKNGSSQWFLGIWTGNNPT